MTGEERGGEETKDVMGARPFREGVLVLHRESSAFKTSCPAVRAVRRSKGKKQKEKRQNRDRQRKMGKDGKGEREEGYAADDE
jgi:hypothetical protein